MKPGETFEIDGQLYEIADDGTPQQVVPNLDGLDESYIHNDGAILICKCGCGQLVQRGKNPRKRFVNHTHYARYHARLYRASHKGETGESPIGHVDLDEVGRPFRLIRPLPMKTEMAFNRYQRHIGSKKGEDSADCPFGEPHLQGRCPFHLNRQFHGSEWWERQHRGGKWPGVCLIAAVLQDDYFEWCNKDKGLEYQRKFTTRYGRWIDPPVML